MSFFGAVFASLTLYWHLDLSGIALALPFLGFLLIGLFLASNIVINLHRPDLLLPSMALVVGFHFLPIAFAAGFRPFYILGAALIVAATVGFVMGAPMGGEAAGFMAAGVLWLASGIAIRRDWLAKSKTPATA
ncbi:hypothetical protein [Acetobacter orleanensis]|nr:hypothetical protein [Acetobacter orleanensis]PCD78521.1 hypothetical protein CO710_11895 [Acetobacter orleanensis]